MAECLGSVRNSPHPFLLREHYAFVRIQFSTDCRKTAKTGIWNSSAPAPRRPMGAADTDGAPTAPPSGGDELPSAHPNVLAPTAAARKTCILLTKTKLTLHTSPRTNKFSGGHLLGRTPLFRAAGRSGPVVSRAERARTNWRFCNGFVDLGWKI